MAKLIILRGNSGSGKSTVSKLLQRRFGRNTMIISQDIIRREMLWVHDGVGNKALPLLIELMKYGKENSEATKITFGDEIYAFYYDLSFEETLKRHATKPNRMEFGEEDMRRWWKEKDFIGSIPEMIIDKDSELSETVESIYEMVSKPR